MYKNRTTFQNESNSRIMNQKTRIKNFKHGTTKTSPMRLKIVRSRETSPVMQSSTSQTKIMGNISIKKITLVKNSQGQGRPYSKPLTTQISLCKNQPKLGKSDKGAKRTKNSKVPKGHTASKTKGYINGAKHVELSFEEELDVDNIYKQNSILNEDVIQQSKRPKQHRRKNSEFEEEGKENLSSEGDETDTKERNYLDTSQKRFTDLSRKFSRNPGFSQVGNFKTDIPTKDTSKISAQFLSQKSSFGKYNQKVNEKKRKVQGRNSKIQASQNRSRNAGRHQSRDSENYERVTSSILSDKLRDTLKHSKKKS